MTASRTVPRVLGVLACAGVLLAVVLSAGCGNDATPAAPAADGAAAGGAGSGGAAAPADLDLSGANLVIISLDTLRADGTSMGGGPPNASPALAELAGQGVLFTHARTQAPHTAPSHMTLFTSKLPSVHGVQNVAHEERDGTTVPIIEPARSNIPTLAEVLKLSGFRTVGITDGGNLNPPHGFARGFDEYGYELEGVKDKVDEGVARLEQLAAPGAGRFFLFWHTYQIHAPYVPPKPYIAEWAPAGYDGMLKERIDQLGDLPFKERFGMMKTLFWKDRDSFGLPEAGYLHGLYRGEIRYTDDELTRFVAAMKRTGVLDNSIVVVLSDHGEEFFEHGHWQHEQLFEECLRVLLMFHLPGGAAGGRRIDVPVGLIDVMPTLLELLAVDTSAIPVGEPPTTREEVAASIELPPRRPELVALPGKVKCDGRSLADAVLGRAPVAPAFVVSELIADRAKGGDFERQMAIHANDMTWIRDRVRVLKEADGWTAKLDADGKPIPEDHLYDLSRDPGEEHDLIDDPSSGSIRRAFEKKFEAVEALIAIETAGRNQIRIESLPPEVIAELQALGYIGADADGAAGADKDRKPEKAPHKQP